MELGGGGDHHHHQHESGAGVNPLAVTHLLQHTLRSLCIHENSQWVYAVFWRILPRNYPPPKWDLLQGGGGGAAAAGGARGNRRNWILVWEDGFCNFAADNHNHNSNINNIIGSDHHHHHHHQYPPPPPASSSSAAAASSSYQTGGLLLPEVFFKMSHEIYNYGEGLIGKVAADHSHKWIYKDPNDQEINFLSAWQNSADSPRAWEAQFHSGIKTIALIAVREGVLQLGALHKVIEDLSYVVSLRKKFSYIGSIPGVLLPHPSSSLSSLSSSSSSSMSSSSSPSSSSSSFHPYRPDCAMSSSPLEAATWLHHLQANHLAADHQFFHFNHNYMNINNNNNNQAMAMMRITPSMSSLEALLSKLPSVVPPPPPHPVYCHDQAQPTVHSSPVVVVAKEEEKREREEDEEEEEDAQEEDDDHHHHHHHQYGHVREEDIMGVENNSSCLSSYDHLRHDDSFGYHFHHHQL